VGSAIFEAVASEDDCRHYLSRERWATAPALASAGCTHRATLERRSLIG
jgi:hypothetical protein